MYKVGFIPWIYQRTNKKFVIQKGSATFSTTPYNMEEKHETHQIGVNDILLEQH